MSKGQLSIEFLMITAAVISFLLVFVSGFAGLQEAALLTLDVQNAKRFVNELEVESKTLSLMGEGSQKTFSYKIIHEWTFQETPETELIVTANSGKKVSIKLPENISLQLSKKTFEKDFSARLIKYNESILLIN